MERGLSLICAAILLAFGTADECSSTCGTPSGLEFCSYVSFAVCGGDLSYTELDEAALLSFQSWSNVNTNTSRLATLPQYHNFSQKKLTDVVKTLDLTNSSSACGTFLSRMECAAHFPVCEVGRDVTKVCLASCQTTVYTQCPGLSNMCSTFDETEVEKKSNKCFKVGYSGPAMGMWVAGFLISLVFSVLNSVGINLQKLSMSRNDTAKTKKTTFKQPLWMLGFGLVCLGSLLDFVAFGMAPQTLLAPLAALSLVWNMLIAPIFHKEKVTRQNLIATAIIFIGVTLTVIFAGHSTPSYELNDLIHLYQQPAMYAYITLIGCFLGGLFTFCRYIERTHNFEEGLFHIICYGGIAGTFGGQSVLLAKSTVELLKSAIWGDAGFYMFTQITSYAIVAGMGTCLGFQVHFLNGGLARFDALVVIPVYQSFWILTSVLGGIMYFEEYVSMTRTQLLIFTVGGCVTILGIIVLLKTRHSGGDGRYSELVLTPISAWTVEDSDEEIELNLPPSHSLNPSRGVGTKFSSGAVVPLALSKVADRGLAVNAAIYRTEPASTGNSNRISAKIKDLDE
ncbi:Phospholipase D, Pi-TM-PLD [Plasmopara halstedii]|uniref:Phospholipase D, Pi-TM-PLD n=1 Tax=Plasmopara halstedii TaxID=4781 RepID=A0A0P1ANU1_PLAHL|nr:Phospholipase D, Pi-TM-PLD [Plasmopara halstedii]CEG43108.1 Phospholipase D, Pi-TM-PLD [Plasmopara halstedii]|eukprot:XP_024579477.1 Phospholipase D, Pi-TM-PLD [Plasmopara halstedii]